MIINEQSALRMISKAKKILLLEPQYTRKYIPLGLAKIATFAKSKKINVEFSRTHKPGFDLICMTSLFTTEIGKVKEALKECSFFESNTHTPILLGGICATLMPKAFDTYRNLKIFVGFSKRLDQCVPDYNIDWGVDEKFKDFAYVFTTRGCPNSCAYCAVKRLEGQIQWINPSWKAHIVESKENILISDNNLSACEDGHLNAVVDYLIEKRKGVLFDSGFDCKHITKEMAQKLGQIKFVRRGMRLAFDRIEEDGIFQNAVELLKENGVIKSQIMVYVLFNFLDTPREAHYRLSECRRLGIGMYPQCYTPLNRKSKKNKYIGKYWTKNLIRGFRYYWLMAGFFNKMSFEEYLGSNLEMKASLTREDWEKWNYKNE